MQSGGNYAFGFDMHTVSAFTEQVMVERNEGKIECATPFSVDSQPNVHREKKENTDNRLLKVWKSKTALKTVCV